MTKQERKRKTSALIFGVILVSLGSVGLFWNEWRAASRIGTLLEAERAVVEAAFDRVPAGSTEGLLHLAGPARPSSSVGDPDFDVEIDALRLDRTVEMYQWREREQGSGNDRTYRYEKVWSERRIRSEQFRERRGHENPPSPEPSSTRFFPDDVALGAYGLSSSLLDLLPAGEAVPPRNDAPVTVAGQRFRPVGNALLTGTPNQAQIGDLRVRYRAVPLGEISVVAGLDGSVLVPWTAPSGGTVAIAELGIRPLDTMLGSAHREISLRTWGFRAVGGIAVLIGWSILLARAAHTFPFLSDLKARLSGPVALTVALAWSLAIIALAWVIFRPLMSFGLLLASGLSIGLLRVLRGRLRDEDLIQRAD